jgi:hypothetical protein
MTGIRVLRICRLFESSNLVTNRGSGKAFWAVGDELLLLNYP